MRIKRTLQKLVNPFLHAIARRLLNVTPLPRTTESNDLRLRFLAGRIARNHYPELLPGAGGASDIRQHEFSVFSQHGEDGVLLHLFSRIGLTNRRFVEFGVEDGTECNAANLAIHFGFSGLMMDGSQENVNRGRRFYDVALGPRAKDVAIVQSWITAENINETLQRHGVTGEIDLLSIDIDGNDFWVWKAIHVVSPRIVVIEYNAALGPDRSWSIPYRADFNRWDVHPSGFYFGASLAALTKLGTERGYTLVGCESWGANAFYVRNDALAGQLPGTTPQQAHTYLSNPVLRGVSAQQQFDMIRKLPWDEV